MRTPINFWGPLILVLVACPATRAECSLDHLLIGCNRDGIKGTEDDETLFVDCAQKYRHSGQDEFANWFYPLRQSIFPSYSHRIGEPGFDTFQSENTHSGRTYDPNRALAGDPSIDYDIVVECVSLSPGLRAVHKEYPQFTMAAAGERFSHSQIYDLRRDGHIHMSYQAVDGESLHWITFRLCDDLDDGEQYAPSEPFTIVFNIEPLAGDLVVDGKVDLPDLVALIDYWLSDNSSQENDFCERADMNRDGWVDVFDFALLTSNWLTPAEGDVGAPLGESFSRDANKNLPEM
jgi:Dockerin type I domain